MYYTSIISQSNLSHVWQMYKKNVTTIFLLDLLIHSYTVKGVHRQDNFKVKRLKLKEKRYQ